jgi:hypothetical protein
MFDYRVEGGYRDEISQLTGREMLSNYPEFALKVSGVLENVNLVTSNMKNTNKKINIKCHFLEPNVYL